MNEPLSILLPYQRRWLADQSQVKVSEKSRRIGITWTEAADRALGAATTGRAGIDGWYIGYNKDMALEFIEAAARWARRSFQGRTCSGRSISSASDVLRPRPIPRLSEISHRWDT